MKDLQVIKSWMIRASERKKWKILERPIFRNGLESIEDVVVIIDDDDDDIYIMH